MNPDGPRAGKVFVFTVAGKADVVVVIGLRQLRSTGPAMGIMTIEAEDPRIEMTTLLQVEPLLVMGFRMSLRVSPDSRLKLVIVGKRFSQFIRFVVFIIPWIFKGPIRNANPSRVALAAHLQASFVR
jgi:hypothetical protein